MAELIPRERLQPCLLDRLTDEEPDKPSESRDRRVISMSRYRQAVLRDLSWLLNSGTQMPAGDLDDFPFVKDSVLNYGVPSLTGLAPTHYGTRELEDIITEAIRRFESRIIAQTLNVRVDRDEAEMNHRAMAFYVEGDMWALPAPEALYIKSEVDLDTGQCAVSGVNNG